MASKAAINKRCISDADFNNLRDNLMNIRNEYEDAFFLDKTIRKFIGHDSRLTQSQKEALIAQFIDRYLGSSYDANALRASFAIDSEYKDTVGIKNRLKAFFNASNKQKYTEKTLLRTEPLLVGNLAMRLYDETDENFKNQCKTLISETNNESTEDSNKALRPLDESKEPTTAPPTNKSNADAPDIESRIRMFFGQVLQRITNHTIYAVLGRILLLLVIGVIIYSVIFNSSMPSSQFDTPLHGDPISTGDSGSQKSTAPFSSEKNFVQASEMTITGIGGCVWVDDIKVERNKQYVVRVWVQNDADETLNLSAKNVSLRLNTNLSPGNYAKSVSIKGSISFSGADAPVENEVLFHGDEPFTLEFIENTGRYSCGGMTSLDERGISVSDDAFLNEDGVPLGYASLDGNIPSGEDYAGYYTILVRPRFETEASSSWGPARALYAVENPSPYVTFNSIINNPKYGNETNFVWIKRANESGRSYSDNIALEPGQEYEVLVYYDNDSTRSSLSEDVNFANDVRLHADIPSLVEANSEVLADVDIFAENATPQLVWDSVVLVNDTDGGILLRYVPDSATIHNFGKTNGTALDATSLFSDEGVLLGYDELDGIVPSDVPGEKSFSGYVTFRIMADQPDFQVGTFFRDTGTGEWSERAEARAGDIIQCLIEYENTGTTQQNNVVLKPDLPYGVHYVEGSTHMRTGTNPNIWLADWDIDKGANVGNYAPNASVLFWFEVRIDEDVVAQNGTTRLVSVAHAITVNGSRSSRAYIDIVK